MSTWHRRTEGAIAREWDNHGREPAPVEQTYPAQPDLLTLPVRSVELQYPQRHFDTALSLWCLMDSLRLDVSTFHIAGTYNLLANALKLLDTRLILGA